MSRKVTVGFKCHPAQKEELIKHAVSLGLSVSEFCETAMAVVVANAKKSARVLSGRNEENKNIL
jgi:hypothetical protein